MILNGAVIVLGLFAAFSLFFKNQNRSANRLMALFLISTSLWLIDNFMRIAGIYEQDPDLYFKPIYYSFAFGPLLYFYVLSIVNSEFKFRPFHLIHFIPVLLQAGLYFFLTWQDYDFKRWYWQEIHLPYTYRIEFDGSFISMALYSFFAIRLLNAYQKWLDDTYSDTSKSKLNWLKVMLILMLVLTLQWFVELILRDLYANYYQYNFSPLILGLLTLILAFRAFHQEDQKEIVYQKKAVEPPKTNTLDFKQEVLTQIEARMLEHQDYLDPTLKLKTFAANCQLPQKVVSQYLNQRLHQSFHDYVNHYRIEEFKKRLAEEKGELMTFEGLAYDCGFNSKATFNRIFKKLTGLTPSQYAAK
ncbi:MAG: helix-turn-helix domain-containing protein [Bacteroidota bacterium]